MMKKAAEEEEEEEGFLQLLTSLLTSPNMACTLKIISLSSTET